MSEIDDMATSFESSLVKLARVETSLTREAVPSCKTELIGRVYDCAGLAATSTAEVYADLIDSVTTAAIHRAGPRQREATVLAIAAFHEEAIERIVELETLRLRAARA